MGKVATAVRRLNGRKDHHVLLERMRCQPKPVEAAGAPFSRYKRRGRAMPGIAPREAWCPTTYLVWGVRRVRRLGNPFSAPVIAKANLTMPDNPAREGVGVAEMGVVGHVLEMGAMRLLRALFR